MRIIVLMNQAAGTASKEEISAATVEAAFRAAGVDATVEQVDGKAMAARARAVLDDGFDAIVAAGGDGTVSCVAGVVAGTQMPLGVLPLGTLNHFAKDIGIPADLEAAAQTIAAGHVRALDLGEVNGETFINTSSLGFYPPMVQERDRQRKRLGRGKWTAALSALFKVLPKVHALRLAITVDGQTLHRTTRLVFVGNNEYKMSVFTQGERKGLDSGFLYLYMVKRPSRLLLVRLALRALVSDAGNTKDFESFCVPCFTIEYRKKSERKILVFLDGEVRSLAPPLRYRVRAKDLRVLAPEPDPA
ncbi:MAG TPA: diacylglycerol kinase family protein [Thermoanaerobaculia bacterium]|jgi:diacylglycerol kinase family enzyme|nr:diacylglycerol kinase family protein [Thermoanaerobaculia bacterium]